MTTLFGYDIGDWSGASGYLGDIFTPKNIVEGIGEYGKISSAADSREQEAANLQTAFDQKQLLADQDLKNAMTLAQFKASLAGGGGGGGGGGAAAAALAFQRQNARYQGRLAVGENNIQTSQSGAALTIQALKNLMEGAQRPLSN